MNYERRRSQHLSRDNNSYFLLALIPLWLRNNPIPDNVVRNKEGASGHETYYYRADSATGCNWIFGVTILGHLGLLLRQDMIKNYSPCKSQGPFATELQPVRDEEVPK